MEVLELLFESRIQNRILNTQILEYLERKEVFVEIDKVTESEDDPLRVFFK